MKVAINKCFGGFTPSDAAYERMIELGVPCVFEGEGRADGLCIVKMNSGRFGQYYSEWPDEHRSDPRLIQAIEELGQKASGSLSRIVVVEIPDDVQWEIDDYDGQESIHEKHRSW